MDGAIIKAIIGAGTTENDEMAFVEMEFEHGARGAVAFRLEMRPTYAMHFSSLMAA